LLKKNKSKVKKIYVTETRPKNQGLLTVNDLKGVMPVTFIVDSACGHYMKDTDMVILGSDALRPSGIINKIGTLPLAITAKEFGKPVYVVASTLKVDKRKSFEIEMRDSSEIHKSIKDMKILNPAFDETSYRYISKIITEKGILKPREILKMVKK
jgi:translation initiation factor 2B subunit (eIF-2B alpha/beta/delta family)